MKIAIFTDIYAPWGSGGIASSVKAQKDSLLAMGHDVLIFCPGGGAVISEPNVVTVPSHKWVKINNSVLSKRPRAVERYVLKKVPELADFDVIHVHYEASCSIAGIRLAKKLHKPLVQTMHGKEDVAIATNVPRFLCGAVAGILNWLHSKCLPHEIKMQRDRRLVPSFARAKMWELMVNHANQADVVLVPSEHFANDLRKHQVMRKTMVLSNGISECLIGDASVRRELKEGETLRMIWNSRVSKEKRVMEFLQALRNLSLSYHVEIFGDGNMLKKAKRYAQKHNLAVEFFGAVSRERLVKHMQRAHLCVMMSYGFDTQGMVLLEAEATGLPVFFCDSNLTETVPEGGYILADGPEASCITEALENLQVQQIAEMSKVMLRHRDEIWQDVQTRKLLNIYKEVIDCHKYDTMKV